MAVANSRTRSIVLCGLSIALLAVGAAIQLPLGPVPFTLQTLMLVLIALILSPKEAVVAVGGYLLLGMVGLPVFAGFKGGIGVLFGPTGGFLVGFLAAVLINMAFCGLFARRVRSLRQSLALDIGSTAILLLTSYSLGCLWFAVSTGATIALALSYCVIPFVLPDIIKAAAAFSCAQPIRLALGRAPWLGTRSGSPSNNDDTKAKAQN